MAQDFPIIRSIARYGMEATEKTAWDRAARESHNYEILHPYSRMRFPLKLSANPHKCGTHSFCGVVQRNSTVDQPPLMSTQYVHYACPLSIHTVQQYVIAFVTVPRIDPRYSIVNSYLSRICGRYMNGTGNAVATRRFSNGPDRLNEIVLVGSSLESKFRVSFLSLPSSVSP